MVLIFSAVIRAITKTLKAFQAKLHTTEFKPNIISEHLQLRLHIHQANRSLMPFFNPFVLICLTSYLLYLAQIYFSNNPPLQLEAISALAVPYFILGFVCLLLAAELSSRYQNIGQTLIDVNIYSGNINNNISKDTFEDICNKPMEPTAKEQQILLNTLLNHVQHYVNAGSAFSVLGIPVGYRLVGSVIYFTISTALVVIQRRIESRLQDA